jgi:shikimate kinase
VAVLTLAIPETLFKPFQDFLNSTLSISRYVQSQVRTKKAIAKVQSLTYQQKLREESKRVYSHVLAVYDSIFATGCTTREAVKETRDRLNSNGNFYTCMTVELIIRQYGRLGKSQRRDKPDDKKCQEEKKT